MKTCPYCGEEVQNSAKKCRYCGEFFVEEKKSEKECFKQYGFWGRFFRKDLGLNKKRGHRLLKIIFFLILIFSFIIRVAGQLDGKHYYRTSNLSDRIDKKMTELQFNTFGYMNLPDLLEEGEIIGDDFYCDEKFKTIYNNFSNHIHNNEEKYYCATKRNNKNLENLSSNKSYPYYDNTNPNNRKIIEDYLIQGDQRKLKEYLNTENIYTDIDTVRDFLNSNNRKCISIDGIVNTNFQFLDYSSQYTEQNLCFLKRNSFTKILHVVEIYGKGLIVSGIVGFILMLLYYKVIIYIIYGSYKKNN